MIETDALIVGAGPVGLFQVFQLGLLDIHCHVIDALPHPGGQCAELYPSKPIYDIPGVPATTGQGLVQSLMQQIAPFTRNGSAQLHWGQQVSTVSKQADGRFEVGTSTGQTFITRTLFIAAGAGAFVPRKLKLEGLDALEGGQVLYQAPADLSALAPLTAGRHVLIQGDDDKALGWAVQSGKLQQEASSAAPASVTLVHRREVFTAAPELVAAMNALQKQGHLRFVAAQITGSALDTNQSPARLTGVQLALPDGRTEDLPVDLLLASLGVSPKLGPIADWGLELMRKQIPVDTEKFQTLEPGIFAVGDINTYPGKKKLIVCGFHECVLAAFGAAEIIFDGKAPLLQYTTTSTRLHALLGVQHGDSQHGG
jgi:thioredoxin reductase (NADPH)